MTNESPLTAGEQRRGFLGERGKRQVPHDVDATVDTVKGPGLGQSLDRAGVNAGVQELVVPDHPSLCGRQSAADVGERPPAVDLNVTLPTWRRIPVVLRSPGDFSVTRALPGAREVTFMPVAIAIHAPRMNDDFAAGTIRNRVVTHR